MTWKYFFKQHTEDDALGAKIKAATTFHMDTAMQSGTREYLASYIAHHPAATSRFTRHRKRSFLYPFVATTLIVALATGTAGAAEQTIPGDTLYPVKVSITEPLREVFAVSAESKAEWAIERAERRITEINQLASHDNLEENIRTGVDERLDAQVRAAEEKIALLEDKTERPGAERRLLAVLRAHEAILGDVNIGVGGSVEEVTFEEMVAATEATTSPEDTDASTLAVTLGVAEVTLSQGAAKTASSSPAPSPAPAKKTASAVRTKTKHSGGTETALKRQRKAAGERVEALERLIARMEKREQTPENVLHETRAGLAAARDALKTGESAYTEESWTDASAYFNIALRTALDTRESLSERQDEGREDGERNNEGRGENNGSHRDRD